MKVFITGGTGFIGSRVVDQLLARGDQVWALVRSPKDAENMRRRGIYPVVGDLNDRESMREAMRGAQVVFHIAGWYKVGARHQEMAERINVDGTRTVLELAYELGVPRIVYTSTIAIFGDTGGQLVDESYRKPPGQPFLTEYDRSKWKAHYEVVEPLVQRGAPIITVMPGGTYGPGDPSLVGDFLTLFLRGWLPVVPGPDMTITYAHVDDIARGHLMAAEHGKPGESYILAGPAMPAKEIMPLWAELSGKRAPYGYIPARLIQPLAPVMEFAARFLPVPAALSRDTITLLESTYIARADKAKRELGWSPRDLRQGMQETVAWAMGRVQETPPMSARQKEVTGLAVIGGAALALTWLFLRKKRS